MIGRRSRNSAHERVRRFGVGLLLLVAAVLIAQAGWIHGKGWLGQALMARAWTEARESGRAPESPWPGARTRPVARLIVPELRIDRLVLDGAELPNLAWGPGMSRGSQGHRVIAGHRDTHFRFLGDLAPGQQLQLESGGGEIVDWQVVERRIVDSRTTSIDLDAPGPLLTLLTCYPLEGLDSDTPFRLVLAARPVDRTEPLESTAEGQEVLAWAP